MAFGKPWHGIPPLDFQTDVSRFVAFYRYFLEYFKMNSSNSSLYFPRFRTILGIAIALLPHLSIMWSSHAYAADEEDAETQTPKPAVWLETTKAHPSWLDTRANPAQPENIRIVATGAKGAIFQLDGAYYLTDPAFKARIPISFPLPPQWLTLTETGRILFYGNDKLYTSADIDLSQLHQAAPILAENFTSILALPNTRAIDGADDFLAYANDDSLFILDLAHSQVRSLSLTDFFNDEKVAAMTPEAVERAEAEAKNPKKTRTKTKTTPNDTASPATTQIAEILGVWWRHDGVGIIRVRSLLNVRTFITRDYGKSWTQIQDAPNTLVHEFGLLYDGASRVLSRDGKTWIDVVGETLAPADRFLASSHLVSSPQIPENWTRLSSPDTPACAATTPDASPLEPSDTSKTTASSERSATEQTENDFSCTPAPVTLSIPTAIPSHTSAHARNNEGLYAPPLNDMGFQIGLYSDARCLIPDHCTPDTMQAPHAWMRKPGEETPTPASLPEGCMPLYMNAQLGIGVVFCYASDTSVDVYTRSENSEWVKETTLPAEFSHETRMFAASDGSLTIVGKCDDESTPDTTTNSTENDDSAFQPLPVRVCPVAVRQPNEIGILAKPIIEPNIIQENNTSENENVENPDLSAQSTIPTWRVENTENAIRFIPMTGGQYMTIENNGASALHFLKLHTPQTVETLLDAFDPSPYDGIIVTDEGCLALYDARQNTANSPLTVNTPGDPHMTQNEDAVLAQNALKLLSIEGRHATMSCSDSRQYAIETRQKLAEAESDVGDDHYGVRLGAGGFFTTDIQTWFMRIEALIPVYSGRYEVGLMYRMGGGNKSTAMGHLGMASIRWRYDDFEKFDFAIGAGLGFGSMCGYEKPKNQSANEDEEDENAATKTSGYEKCSKYSIRYLISGIATYKLNKQWKIFIGAELLGGSSWGFDLSGGLEIRF